MTTTTEITGSTTVDRERAHRAATPLGIAAFVIAGGLSLQGADSVQEAIVEVVLQLAVAAVLFAVVVPRGLRHESAGGRGLAMGIVALLLVVPAFWSGLPLLLGTAAAVLGYAGKRASARAGLATASLVIGLLAVVAYLAIYVGDYLHVHGIG